jgi:hypothetical protein
MDAIDKTVFGALGKMEISDRNSLKALIREVLAEPRP